MKRINIFTAIIVLLSVSLFPRNEALAQEVKLRTNKIDAPVIEKIIQDGNFNEAIVKLNEKLEFEPSNTELLNLLGDLYNHMALYKEAINIYEKSYKIDSNSHALFGEAIVNFFIGDFVESKKQFVIVIRSGYRLIDSYNFMGKIELLNGDLAEAENYFNKTYSIDSVNVDAITNLGIIYQQLELIARAEMFLKKAVDLSSNDSDSYLNLGVFYGMTDRFNEAIINLNKAISLNSNNKKPYRALGVIYLNYGIYSEAEDNFNKVLKLDPFDNEIYFNMVVLYAQQSDYNKAIKTFEKMQILGLSHPQLYIAVSNIYFKQNDLEEALKYSKVQVTSYPDKIEGYLALLGMYKFMGLNKEYDELYEKVKEKIPLSSNNMTKEIHETITNFLNNKRK